MSLYAENPFFPSYLVKHLEPKVPTTDEVLAFAGTTLLTRASEGESIWVTCTPRDYSDRISGLVRGMFQGMKDTTLKSNPGDLKGTLIRKEHPEIALTGTEEKPIDARVIIVSDSRILEDEDKKSQEMLDSLTKEITEESATVIIFSPHRMRFRSTNRPYNRGTLDCVKLQITHSVSAVEGRKDFLEDFPNPGYLPKPPGSHVVTPLGDFRGIGRSGIQEQAAS